MHEDEHSDYGTIPAALIVEKVSGIPYQRYLVEKKLQPLEMAHAILAHPLPKELAWRSVSVSL